MAAVRRRRKKHVNFFAIHKNIASSWRQLSQKDDDDYSGCPWIRRTYQ